MNTTKDEAGRTVLVSWQYPIPQHVKIGWITLIYELRYKADSEPNKWKVLIKTRAVYVVEELFFCVHMSPYKAKLIRCYSDWSHLADVPLGQLTPKNATRTQCVLPIAPALFLEHF